MKQVFTYDTTIYSREVLVKAAFRFIDQSYIHLDKIDDRYIVEIKNKEGKEAISKERYDEEMLLQLARFVVAEKTKDIRKMTIARAFASTIIDDRKQVDEDDDLQKIQVSEDILKDWFENE